MKEFRISMHLFISEVSAVHAPVVYIDVIFMDDTDYRDTGDIHLIA
jgi:hypothetical protein